MRNPKHLVIYDVTCPDCDNTHFLHGWQPGCCPCCGADLGGCGKDTLKAVEMYYPISLNALTGEVWVRPENE